MDNENIIYVDADTREAVLHSNFKIGVVNDDSCHTLTFRINKDSDIDLTDLTFYVNTTSSRGNGDRLDCTKEEDGQYIFIKCLLKGTLFEAKGKATINLCGRKYDSNSTIIKKWGSEDITVLVGSHTDADKAIEERYPSVLEDLKSKIENLNITDEQINTIATKVAEKGFYTKSEIDSMIADIVVPTRLSQLADDANHRLVTDAEKSRWNSNTGGTGISTEAIYKLEEVGNYLAYTTADGGAKWTELISILRNGSSGEGSGGTEKTLSSISATYIGGDVTVGTALTSLTGITVTATYSDGTTKTVTGYTLSGEILEGENIITVSYGGKTTTFTVTGIVESGGGDTTAELPTDGLVSYFDFRTCEYNNAGSGGPALIQPTQGNGQLFAWANNFVAEQNEYGMKVIRNCMFDENGGNDQSECGETFTWVFKCYLTSFSSPMFSADYATLSNVSKIEYKPKYNTASSTAQVAKEGFGTRLVDAYDLLILVVDKNICKLYFGNELIKKIDGNTIDGFVSWYSKLTITMLGGKSTGYLTQLAIYNKALSDVEITEMQAYLKTLEVA